MFKRTILCLALMILTLSFGSKTAYAAPADDNFYKGKTIRLIVAFSAGGGYDTYSRNNRAASQ